MKSVWVRIASSLSVFSSSPLTDIRSCILSVSSDDDMRPYALMEYSPESLNTDEFSRGRLHRAGENSYKRKSFDIIASFLDVLGKPVSQAPDNYERGESLRDTAMDLETNATMGLVHAGTLAARADIRRCDSEDGPDIPLRHQRYRDVSRRRGANQPRRSQ
jgi:hypothetical protein